jgi:uncharacterized SAM-binding protein YcdF (DUF218 family)
MQNESLSSATGVENKATERVSRRGTKIILWSVVVLAGCAAVFASARFLLIDEPRHADAILVLAGETNVRLTRAVQLAAEGYAPRVIMDVPDWTRFYGRSELDLAREWARTQPVPITICPTHGLSTKDEAREAGVCLDAAQARSTLIITSDFHTRRALSILRHELPSHQFSVAAAYDPTEFGVKWWQHRQWTKTNFYEWTRLVWWEFVDRWF